MRKTLLGLLLTVALQPSVAQNTADTLSLDEVVVTGTNQAMPARLLPYTVSLVYQKQLESTGKTQLLAALQGVPSVFVRLDNIADKSYVINRGYEMPGFTAMGGVKLRF